MLVQATELKIAADADAPDALPDNDTLHGWARAALGRTRFGEMLVALAWAFHRRGDDDMARHLLAEAPSRIPRSSLEKTSPRVGRVGEGARPRMEHHGMTDRPRCRRLESGRPLREARRKRLTDGVAVALQRRQLHVGTGLELADH